MKRAGHLALLLLLLAAVTLAVWAGFGRPLKRAHELWLGGHSDEATAVLLQWRRWHVRTAHYDEALAATLLSTHRVTEAKPILHRLSGHRFVVDPPFEKIEVARRLVAAGNYADFLLFDDSIHDGTSHEVELYRVAALLGLGRSDEAGKLLQTIPKGVEPQKRARLAAAVTQLGSTGLAVVVDRNGQPLATFDAKANRLHAADPSFAALVEAEAGAHTLGANLAHIGTMSALETSLDPEVQRAALEALGRNRGSMVVLDVRSGELLAIASSSGDGPLANLAMETRYEPGSVIKVLTAINSIDHGAPLTKFFPLDCQGFLNIDGAAFKDWARHDRLASLNEAMATSCNVAFAQMGMALGSEELDRFLTTAGFDEEVELGYCSVPLGKREGFLLHRMELAQSAVGLGHEKINALHLAMLADAVANGGTLRTPRLIRARRTILGDEVRLSEQRRVERKIASPAALRAVIEAMRSVVTDERGTGRRAEVEGVDLAMKTGTAGSREPGYDALIMAFAPASKPRIAIGVIAEHAGPAEFEGARITHDFFTAMKNRLAP